jgi:hypothetical protein
MQLFPKCSEALGLNAVNLRSFAVCPAKGMSLVFKEKLIFGRGCFNVFRRL